jgi:hypothetical protein
MLLTAVWKRKECRWPAERKRRGYLSHAVSEEEEVVGLQ